MLLFVFTVFSGVDFLVSYLAESEALDSDNLLGLSIDFAQRLPSTLMIQQSLLDFHLLIQTQFLQQRQLL